MKLRQGLIYLSLLFLGACGSSSISGSTNQISTTPESTNASPTVVAFPSGDKTLHGYLSKPAGNGPFPVVIFNHGSEPDPGPRESLEKFYTDLGFLVFEPHRTGHGLSADAGTDIITQTEALQGQGLSPQEMQAAIWDLHETANEDVIASVQWLKSQPDVDTSRIAMSGCSYGGIQTIITAEKSVSLGLGIRAFVPFAPGAQSWNNYLSANMTQSVQNASPPIFLIQAENDYSLGPSEVLGPILESKPDPNGYKDYPAFGTTVEEGHCGFSLNPKAIPIWSPDVLGFFEATGVM